MMFDILTAWDGTSVKLDKLKSYHQTTPLSPEQARKYIAKSKSQDKELWVMLKARGSATPRQLLARRPNMLISSIRRSLNTLTNKGILIKGACVEGGMGHPEHEWKLP